TINCLNSGDRTVGTDTPTILGLACGTSVRPPAAVATATVASVATVAVCIAVRNVWTTGILPPGGMGEWSTLGLVCCTSVKPPAAAATATVTSVATIAVRAAALNVWNNLVLSSPAI